MTVIELALSITIAILLVFYVPPIVVWFVYVIYDVFVEGPARARRMKEHREWQEQWAGAYNKKYDIMWKVGDDVHWNRNVKRVDKDIIVKNLREHGFEVSVTDSDV